MMQQSRLGWERIQTRGEGSMRFERSQRVVYGKNPLAEVLCQIRFPRILELDEALPVEFQKRIQDDYPLAEVKVISVQVSSGASQEAQTAAQPFPRDYIFSDADKAWSITLSSQFVALTSKGYKSWEGFRAKLEKMLAVTNDIYSPRLFTRIGLRYQNLIEPHNLGLEGVKWSELLAPPLVGILTTPPVVEKDVLGTDSSSLFSLDQGRLLLKTGMMEDEQGREAFLIDADFYVEGTHNANVEHTMETFDGFNRQAGGLFRWCISDRVHEALQPNSSG